MKPLWISSLVTMMFTNRGHTIYPFFFLFVCSFSKAQVDTRSGSKEIQFEGAGEKGKQTPKATLKLSERGDLVYLYFEATGLPKGKYIVVKTEGCNTLERHLLSKKPVNQEDELYTFETSYGNMSGENNLKFKSFQEMGLNRLSFALIKTTKKEARVIFCKFPDPKS